MSQAGVPWRSANKPLIDPAARDRFLRDWHALTGTRADDRALIALSGGPDSTALTLLFAAIAPSITPPVAATVDHGLRAASAQEAGVAADLCRRLDIPHTTLTGELPGRVGPTANLSARARALRYALLREHAAAVGATWIVTAHHADDQLETMIMRLNRGTGVGGMAGIRARGEPVVRPLLGWTRAELASLVAAAKVATVDDPSNVDARFDRARVRRQLGDAEWLDARMAARTAAALAEADEAIDWMLDRLEGERCQFDGDQAILDPRFLPAELCRRLVERCLRHVDPTIIVRGGDLTRLVATLSRGEPATLGRVRCGPVSLGRPTPITAWKFERAPPRRHG